MKNEAEVTPDELKLILAYSADLHRLWACHEDSYRWRELWGDAWERLQRLLARVEVRHAMRDRLQLLKGMEKRWRSETKEIIRLRARNEERSARMREEAAKEAALIDTVVRMVQAWHVEEYKDYKGTIRDQATAIKQMITYDLKWEPRKGIDRKEPPFGFRTMGLEEAPTVEEIIEVLKAVKV